MTLDPSFTLYTLSRQLADFDDDDRHDEIKQAFSDVRELAVGAFAHRIDRGLLTPEEARAAAAVMAAIGQDLATAKERRKTLAAFILGEQLAGPDTFVAMRAQAAEFDRPWPDKVAMLRQLVDGQRKRHGRAAEQADRGPLDPALEGRRLEALEALHALYWVTGFGWTSPTGAQPGSETWTAELQAELDRREPTPASQEAA